jgi:hypothetical protein
MVEQVVRVFMPICELHLRVNQRSGGPFSLLWKSTSWVEIKIQRFSTVHDSDCNDQRVNAICKRYSNPTPIKGQLHEIVEVLKRFRYHDNRSHE